MYVRAAAIARRVYVSQGLGVGQLRKVYGGRVRKGHRKEHFGKCSGGHLRYILQQLEKIGILEKYDGAKGGRKITPTGQRDLDQIATRVRWRWTPSSPPRGSPPRRRPQRRRTRRTTSKPPRRRTRRTTSKPPLAAYP